MIGNAQRTHEQLDQPGQGDVPETLLTEIMGAVLSLEYGAVTVSVKDGHVIQVERHEKRRLGRPTSETFKS